MTSRQLFDIGGGDVGVSALSNMWLELNSAVEFVECSFFARNPLIPTRFQFLIFLLSYLPKLN